MIGAVISGSVAVLVALVAHGWVVALIMLGGVIAVQQIEAHVLQPFLLGRFVSVHPLGVIVAIAILNEPDLEAELRGENTTVAGPGDLLENRRITWQYPPPGTPLSPPYVVLVAGEVLVSITALEPLLGGLARTSFALCRPPGQVPPCVIQSSLATVQLEGILHRVEIRRAE